MVSVVVSRDFEVLEGYPFVLAREDKRLCKPIIIDSEDLCDSIFYHVLEEANAQALWEKLKNLYEMKTPYNKTSLIKRLVYLR